MTAEALIKTIFARLLVTLNRITGLSETQIAEIGKRVLAQMQTLVDISDWTAVPVATVAEAMTPKFLFRPIRLVSKSLQVASAQLIDAPPDSGFDGQVETTFVELTDQHGDRIFALDVLGPLVHHLRALSRTGRRIELRCIVVALPLQLEERRPDFALGRNRQSFFVNIIEAVELSGALDLVGATPGERARAALALETLLNQGVPPGRYIRNALVEGLGIVADGAGELLELLDGIVLQALSTGYVGMACGRISMLVVGAAGSGKKLLSLAARVLNPVATELASAKISPAGLIGGTFRRNGRYVLEPGALPSASGGVTTLQDAHGLNWSKVQRLGTVLQEVIEDGVVRDSMLGGGTRVAETAILIDLNRVGQFDRESGPARREAPLLRLYPLLQRIDILAEMSTTPADAFRTAQGMVKQPLSTDGYLDGQPWVRQLKVFTANVRDRYRAVDLSPVQNGMADYIAELGDDNLAAMEHLPEASGLPKRLVNTLQRLTTASARWRGSSVATDEDLAVAIKFANRKVAFMRLQGTEPVAPTSSANAEWVAGFAGQVVRPADLARKKAEETGESVDERTVRRHVKKLGGKRLGKGLYQLPPPQLPPST